MFEPFLSPLLLVVWSDSFPTRLLRVSCDDAFDGEHLVCNSLLETIFWNCGRTTTAEPRNFEWLLHAIMLNAPAIQTTKCYKTLGGADFRSLWLKNLKLESECFCWDPWSPWGSAITTAASKFSASRHCFIFPGCQLYALKLDHRGLPYASIRHPSKTSQTVTTGEKHWKSNHSLERIELSGAVRSNICIRKPKKQWHPAGFLRPTDQ